MITKPFVGVLLALCTARAMAAEVGCISIEQGWARLPASQMMHMTAGFGVIHNRCDREVVIIGASSTQFADVSLHETTQVDGVSRMRHVERLPLAAGASAELKPGGLHLMLMDGNAALQEGQVLPLQLQLESGDQAKLALTVRKQAR
jgi:copper(I)-binding protein